MALTMLSSSVQFKKRETLGEGDVSDASRWTRLAEVNTERARVLGGECAVRLLDVFGSMPRVLSVPRMFAYVSADRVTVQPVADTPLTRTTTPTATS